MSEKVAGIFETTLRAMMDSINLINDGAKRNYVLSAVIIKMISKLRSLAKTREERLEVQKFREKYNKCIDPQWTYTETSHFGEDGYWLSDLKTSLKIPVYKHSRGKDEERFSNLYDRSVSLRLLSVYEELESKLISLDVLNPDRAVDPSLYLQFTKDMLTSENKTNDWSISTGEEINE